jgi:hypothetical protein
MTISTTGYTVGSNQPLNHARILWDMLTGAVEGGGTNSVNPDRAANDFTAQKWTADAGTWTLTTDADAQIDTVVIAGHNLAGKTVTIRTSDSALSGDPTTLRATINPTDNSTIFVMFNNAGTPYTIRRVRVVLTGTDNAVAIIRAGVSLQMERPFYAGHTPATKARVTEGEQSFSETGQWLGRTVKRLALTPEYRWQHLTKTWYDTNFEPFAQTLPAKPFAIAGNPSRMPDDVAWAWTRQDARPVTMGIRDLMEVSLPVTGLR